MFSELTWNRYGKSRVRLVKVRREHEPHELVDLSIDVQLEGAFTAVYADGDNQSCLATDTMKNTVYALARHDPLTHVESFAVHQAGPVPPTLAASAEAVFAARPHINEVTFKMPNRHHLLVDLTPFGLDNPNEIFVATEQPFGLIEATVSR